MIQLWMYFYGRVDSIFDDRLDTGYKRKGMV